MRIPIFLEGMVLSFTSIRIICGCLFSPFICCNPTLWSCSFRSVRNFVIDLRKQPANATATGIHWQVSQATSLINIVFEMSTEPGNNHQGLFMENGRSELVRIFGLKF